ncbi:hypothetical protein [Alsobacter sp. R-9]
MLERRVSDFTKAVWIAAAQVGTSAPRVADHIVESLFPRTCAEARVEGAMAMFREGVIAAAKKVLRGGDVDADQFDFAGIDKQFAPIVETLKSRSYFVESEGEYVSVARLIAEPDLLKAAAEFMRRKAHENMDEFRRLDRLYKAVTGARPSGERAA